MEQIDPTLEQRINHGLHELPAFITATGVSKGPRRSMNDRTCRASDLEPILEIAKRDLESIQKCNDIDDYDDEEHDPDDFTFSLHKTNSSKFDSEWSADPSSSTKAKKKREKKVMFSAGKNAKSLNKYYCIMFSCSSDPYLLFLSSFHISSYFAYIESLSQRTKRE